MPRVTGCEPAALSMDEESKRNVLPSPADDTLRAWSRVTAAMGAYPLITMSAAGPSEFQLTCRPTSSICGSRGCKRFQSRHECQRLAWRNIDLSSRGDRRSGAVRYREIGCRCDLMSDLPSRELAEIIARWRGDPELFVREIFPWGEEGTALAGEVGPDAWQLDLLRLVRENLSPNHPVRIAVSSGHGIGKTALSAWLILWALATEVDTTAIVTANTSVQLATKDWPELAKWFHLSPLLESMFDLTATALTSKERPRTWRADAIPWSIERSEAFAGAHNKGRRLMILFDEASAIDDRIWEVCEGAMSDANTELLWFAFGNPTRNTGRFRECFDGRFRDRWITRQMIPGKWRSPTKSKLPSGLRIIRKTATLRGCAYAGSFRAPAACSSSVRMLSRRLRNANATPLNMTR